MNDEMCQTCGYSVVLCRCKLQMPPPIQHRDPGDEASPRRRIDRRTPSRHHAKSVITGLFLACPNDDHPLAVDSHDLDEGVNETGQTWCHTCQMSVIPARRGMP